ncbi:MAG: PilT/PilU family type 4a pilus ATPase [Nitrospinae bacterium]|nr:PilT/PilU family type 4a pilus ATPase [Nitrospinota bacterium]
MRATDLDYVLTTMLESHVNVSDLNATVGKPFQVESDGQLLEVSLAPPVKKLTPFQSETLALSIINSDRRLLEILLREGACDTSYQVAGKARFRVNIFSQRSQYSVVLRKLATRIATIDELNLPKLFYEVAEEKNGFVLVTGATGSGKSTTLAAMLDAVNQQRSVHVVTLEDPVEFVHPQKIATFNQRELGSDFDTFAHGLRSALRQAPKVILVGEMRDRETVEIGLSAAETGHLVMSTLHTVDAGQTISRIVGMFDRDEEKLLRIRLAETMKWIICQRLVPKVGGGRVAVIEIMGNSLRTKDAILNGEQEGKTFYDIITASEAFGWRTFDMSLVESYGPGLITEETAMAYASHKAVVGRGLDVIKSKRGERTSTIESLSLDQGYREGTFDARKKKR